MNTLRKRYGPALRRGFSDRPIGRNRHPEVSRSLKNPTTVINVPFVRSNMIAQLEAILFQATEPMPVAKLAEALHQTAETVTEAVRQLQSMYVEDDTAFKLDRIGGGYQLRTGPETTPWLVRHKRTPNYHALPANLLETLSIIAERQPVTRADIEAVRGVACAEPVKVLLSMGLIRTAGRHASLGRPQLYATTRRFLQTFGMNSLAELPKGESP